MSEGAKDEILARISAARVSVGAPLARASIEPSVRPRAEIIAQFLEYAGEYKANVFEIDEGELAGVVGRALAARGVDRVVVPGDLPADWLPDGIMGVRDENLSHAALDGMPSVLTGCALAVAETGTIVLDGGARQGRRVISLLPDHHMCVVFHDQIVDSVPEAVAALGEAIRQGRPLTWISGPSATSDIELSRVEGVHGPRNLDIIVVRRKR